MRWPERSDVHGALHTRHLSQPYITVELIGGAGQVTVVTTQSLEVTIACSKVTCHGEQLWRDSLQLQLLVAWGMLLAGPRPCRVSMHLLSSPKAKGR